MSITKALLVLNKEHRAVLDELFFRKRTVSETAHILGISPSTVKSRTLSALRALRDALEQQNP